MSFTPKIDTLCSISSIHCKGAIQSHPFIWYPYLGSKRSQMHNIICNFCEHHYQQLIAIHRGIVPEVRGYTEKDARLLLCYPIRTAEKEMS
jgi:hypothetical protein